MADDFRRRVPNTADHDKYHAPDSQQPITTPPIPGAPRPVDVFAGKGSLADKLRKRRVEIETGSDMDDDQSKKE